MRILLDESLPVELKFELSGYDVSTVQEMGWSGLKNGELLMRASNRFEILITADRNIRYQQNLNKLQVAVVVLVAKSNRIEQLRTLLPELRDVLSSLQPRTLVQVGV
jgi:predicted nuclease of predicted toxin-antitoxin system